MDCPICKETYINRLDSMYELFECGNCELIFNEDGVDCTEEYETTLYKDDEERHEN